jgi:hypothetical protein
MYVFFGTFLLSNGDTIQLSDYWYFDLSNAKWVVLPNSLPQLPIASSSNLIALIPNKQFVIIYLITPSSRSFWFYFISNNTWIPLHVEGHHSTILLGAVATLTTEYHYLYVLGRPLPVSRAPNSSLTILSSFNLYDYRMISYTKHTMHITLPLSETIYV